MWWYEAKGKRHCECGGRGRQRRTGNSRRRPSLGPAEPGGTAGAAAVMSVLDADDPHGLELRSNLSRRNGTILFNVGASTGRAR